MKSKMVIEHKLTVATGLERPDDPPAPKPLQYTTIRRHIETDTNENILTDSSEFPSNPYFEAEIVTDINEV